VKAEAANFACNRKQNALGQLRLEDCKELLKRLTQTRRMGQKTTGAF